MGTPHAAPNLPAFEDYVRDRYAGLLRAAYAISRDAHAAEDLLHAALVRVAGSWHTLREPAAADAYVRRAMINQQASWLRRPAVRAERPVPEVPEPRRPSEDRHGFPLTGAEVWALVCSLPPGQRAAVALRFYEELSEAETAAVLGCSVGTVKSSTSRGLAALRRLADAAATPAAHAS